VQQHNVIITVLYSSGFVVQNATYDVVHKINKEYKI